MRGVFDDEEREPAKARRDTELTLGSGTLLAIFFGLLLLCGLCFGLGYAVGHRGPQAPTAAELPAAGAPEQTSNDSIAKPPAMEQAAQTPATDTADAGQPPSATPGAAPAADAQTLTAPVQPVTPPAAGPGTAQGAPQVHPALAPGAAPGQPNQSGQTAAGANVLPAIAPAAQPPAAQLMVQIAAVSNVEDAQVLTNALRKRGYAVTVRRDPADNLIHVRIGPFATQAEANGWRMRLLNDGYNAIIQP